MTAQVSYFTNQKATVTNLVWTGFDSTESLWLNKMWIKFLEEELSTSEPNPDFAAAKLMADFLGGTARVIIATNTEELGATPGLVF